MKNLNVFIIVIDSVRSYRTKANDDRERLEMMDHLPDQMMHFSEAFASAPSSVMSCASMLTGIPSYFIAKNYDEFKYSNKNFTTLPAVLSENGYDVASAFVAQEMQLKYGSLLNHVDECYFPENVRFGKTEIPELKGVVWKNETLRKICKSYLTKRQTQLAHEMNPLFMMNWFNVRQDPLTSSIITEHLNDLKELGYFENSIIFILSDHGYLDQDRGWTPQKLAEHNLSHDLMLTDDNIKIPFFLHFPNCVPGEYKNMVCTYDIFPTVMQILNIKTQDNLLPIAGQCIVSPDNLNSVEDRYIRIDARFFEQGYQCTAIRSKRFKYIKKDWEGGDEFFDLSKDPFEKENLLHNKDLMSEIDAHKKQLIKSQDMYGVYEVLRAVVQALKKRDTKFVEIRSFPECDDYKAFIIQHINSLSSKHIVISEDAQIARNKIEIVAHSETKAKVRQMIDLRKLTVKTSNKRSIKSSIKIAFAKRKIYLKRPFLFIADIKSYLGQINK